MRADIDPVHAISLENRLRTGLRVRLLDTVRDLEHGDLLSIALPDGESLDGRIQGGPVFRFVPERANHMTAYLKPAGEAAYEFVCHERFGDR